MEGMLFGHVGPGLEQVERALREQLASRGELVGAVGEHVLGSGGKRMRPALLLLAAEMCGYTGPRRVQVAAALELLHTATLLHDDVVDLARVRRGRPAANAVWGNRRAVLVGDFFYARASSMIVEDGDPDVLWVFAETIRLMAEGEILQLQQSFDPEVSEAHYYSVIDRKSATLLGAACEVGAILGGVTRAERKRVATFGRELGLAFQVRDDALDYVADEARLGKATHADLREGKVTLPLLLTLKRCTPGERERIVRALKTLATSATDPSDAKEGAVEPNGELHGVLELVTRYRGVADAMRRAETHAEQARQALAPFQDGIPKRALLAAAEFAVARDR